MEKEKRVILIIQARMESTRLPGKVLKTVLGKPLLLILIERLREVRLADHIVIATTTNPQDDVIEEFCNRNRISVYRGSEEDVLDRYLQAATLFKGEIIVRITADCPLIDPHLVDRVIQYYLTHDFDYVSNTLERTYPRGMDAEVFSINALKQTAEVAKKPAEREHVTLYMYHHPEVFCLGRVQCDQDYSKYRLTVDTQEDFILVSKILEMLYPSFTFEEIISLLESKPELCKVNTHIKQKSIKEN